MVRFLKWLFSISLVLVGLYLAAEWQMKREVKEFLDRKVPDHIDFSYDHLYINLFKGDLIFKNTTVISLGRQTSSCEIRVVADTFSVEGFSYWKFFLDESIYLKKLTLAKPSVNFVTCVKDSTASVNKAQPINLLKPIYIENLIFESGKTNIWNASKDTEILAVNSIDLHIKDVQTDPNIIQNYVPFLFSDYDITIADLKAPLGDYEVLEMETMNLNNSSIDIENVSLTTIYSKKELSANITYERDHIDLKIPKIQVHDHTYAISHDSLLVSYGSLSLGQPYLEMYRDKSKIHDTRRRRLYGEMLRNLSFKLDIDSVLIDKAIVRYEEDAPNKVNAGILTFEDLNATIQNLSNLPNTEDTHIALDADLMGTGEFKLDWRFNVNDTHEKFVVSGELANFETSKLNDFLVPNLRTKTEGMIDQMYFTISGDEYVASGDIKMHYQDFKIQILNKERGKVKKVLSFLGNLFISDGSKADENGFRYGQISTERPKDKSFFNYLWVNLEDGLLSVLTGNGKKE